MFERFHEAGFLAIVFGFSAGNLLKGRTERTCFAGQDIQEGCSITTADATDLESFWHAISG